MLYMAENLNLLKNLIEIPRRHSASDGALCLRDQIYKKLRNAILCGQLHVNQRIVQEDVAEVLNVSRMPVREALKLLEKDGLVVIDNKSTYVSPLFMEKVEEIFFIRKFLEPQAVKLAEEKNIKRNIRTLYIINNGFADATHRGDNINMVDLNKSLHLTLYSLCSYPYIVEMIENLWERFPFYTFSLLPGQGEKAVSEHDSIIKALEAGEINESAILLDYHIEKCRQSYKAKQQDLSGGIKLYEPNNSYIAQ